MIPQALWALSTHARLCLVAGLIAGLMLPGIAAEMVPWLPHMVAFLMVTTALRIGHQETIAAATNLRWSVGVVLVLQLVLPLMLFSAFWLTNLTQTPAAVAVTLAAAAPAITGSLNLALIMRLDAGRMMQLLVLGTALFPLTSIPVLWAMPQLESATAVSRAALNLLGVILGASLLGFAIRQLVFPRPTPGQIKALDGLSVLAFCTIVVGLMAALNPALKSDPAGVFLWVLLAFAVGYGLQLLALLILKPTKTKPMVGPIALAAGNRNIAIFLVALPPDVVAPIMVFIGCWQLPMYLTPLLLPAVYARMSPDD